MSMIRLLAVACLAACSLLPAAPAAASVAHEVHAKTLAFNVVPWLGSDAGGG